MSAFRAVLFDFDGTLVQLRAAPGQMDELRDRLGALLAEAGMHVELRPFYPGVDRALEALRQRDGTEGMRARAVAMIEDYELEFSRLSEACPYAAEALRAAATRFPCGIATGNTRRAVEQGLSMHHIWDAQTRVPLVAFEDVDRHKPDPTPLVRLADLLGLRPGDVAAHVGDHVNDLDACQRFNERGGTHLIPIMVQGGKCRWPDVIAHPGFQPRYAIADLSHLLPLLVAGAP
jgi:phosphoglycolate phosphatase-like HAD superfamily hydrolase